MLRTTVLTTLLAAGAPALAQEGAASAAVPAQIQPALPAFVPRLLEIGRKPFECDLTLKVNAGEGESTTGSGHLAWASWRQFAMDFQIAGEEPVKVKVVADGSFLSFEGSGSEGTQALKVSLDLLGTKQGMEQMAAGVGGMEQLHAMLAKVECKEEVAGGVRRYSGKLDDPAGSGMAVSFLLELDEKSWFPKRIQVSGGEEGSMELATSSAKFPESIPAERFRYQAPEGVQVMDLTPILQLGAAGAGQEY